MGAAREAASCIEVRENESARRCKLNESQPRAYRGLAGSLACTSGKRGYHCLRGFALRHVRKGLMHFCGHLVCQEQSQGIYNDLVARRARLMHEVPLPLTRVLNM